MNGRTARRRKLGNSTERQIRERHMRRMKQLQRQRIIVRSVLLIIAVALLVSALVFLTPIFKVRGLEIEGNNRVSTEAICELLPAIEGENLFKVSENSIKSKLSGINYISGVEVNKKLIPPSVFVTITEKVPVAAVSVDGGYKIIDSECTVLEENPEQITGIPLLSTYHESFDSFVDDSDAMYELNRFFEICDKIEILGEITAIELLEDNEINFEYDGRLKVICGSGLDMEKKLPLLKETVNNPALGSNAHGEIDLSTTGKAVHRS